MIFRMFFFTEKNWNVLNINFKNIHFYVDLLHFLLKKKKLKKKWRNNQNASINTAEAYLFVVYIDSSIVKLKFLLIFNTIWKLWQRKTSAYIFKMKYLRKKHKTSLSGESEKVRMAD